MSNRAPADFRLLVTLYVVLGVPACTAIAVFLLSAVVLILASGGSVDLASSEFWSGVAFVVLPLLVVGIALRAWSRERRGTASFLGPTLVRFVPVLIGLGVLSAAGLGFAAFTKYEDQLANEADSFCFRWVHRNDGVDRAECHDEATRCLRDRPLDERPDARARAQALERCMAATL